MLIFFQDWRTIEKKLSNLRIGSGRTNESNEIYQKEACVARKHLKKRGSEEKNSYPSSQK
jgi:hypothetical protein